MYNIHYTLSVYAMWNILNTVYSIQCKKLRRLQNANYCSFIIFVILVLKYVSSSIIHSCIYPMLKRLRTFNVQFHASFIPPGIKLNDRQEIGVAGA